MADRFAQTFDGYVREVSGVMWIGVGGRLVRALLGLCYRVFSEWVAYLTLDVPVMRVVHVPPLDITRVVFGGKSPAKIRSRERWRKVVRVLEGLGEEMGLVYDEMEVGGGTMQGGEGCRVLRVTLSSGSRWMRERYLEAFGRGFQAGQKRSEMRRRVYAAIGGPLTVYASYAAYTYWKLAA